jgi:hypothetical protein
MKTVFLLLAFGVIGAAAIDNDWDGFVHFKNWKGVVPNRSPGNPEPFKKSRPNPLSVNILKDICASDPACEAIAPSHGFLGTFQDCTRGPYGSSGCPLSQNLNDPLPDTFTNTSYDMFLGIKGEPKTAPAAFCVVESGGGNSPDVKWLHCGANFCFGCAPELAPNYFKNHFDIPPQMIYRACLRDSDCIGFRIKNDGSGGDILQCTGPYCFVPGGPSFSGQGGLFKIP